MESRKTVTLNGRRYDARELAKAFKRQQRKATDETFPERARARVPHSGRYLEPWELEWVMAKADLRLLPGRARKTADERTFGAYGGRRRHRRARKARLREVQRAETELRDPPTFTDPITLDDVPKHQGVRLNKQWYQKEALQKMLAAGLQPRVPHSRRALKTKNLRRIYAHKDFGMPLNGRVYDARALQKVYKKSATFEHPKVPHTGRNLTYGELTAIKTIAEGPYGGRRQQKKMYKRALEAVPLRGGHLDMGKRVPFYFWCDDDGAVDFEHSSLAGLVAVVRGHVVNGNIRHVAVAREYPVKLRGNAVKDVLEAVRASLERSGRCRRRRGHSAQLRFVKLEPTVNMYYRAVFE